MAPESTTEMVEKIAAALGDLRESVVFLGGATVPLLVTDLGASLPRPTADVDMAVDVSTQAEFARFEKRLRDRGFSPDPDGPMGRYCIGPLKADFTPASRAILGFTNKWYALALTSASRFVLPSGTEIRLASAPVLVATKFEAFKDRGHGDLRASHDLEDIVSLVDGRPELVSEIRGSSPELRDYLAGEFASLLAQPAIEEIVEGLLPPDPTSQARGKSVISTFNAIVDLGTSIRRPKS